MAIPTDTLIAATWNDGIFVYTGEARRQELAGKAVNGLATDPRGDVLAIVDGHEVCRRTQDGKWTALARSPLDLACLVAADDAIYLGTDDAQVLRMDAEGRIAPLPGFDSVQGRESWYAGSAVIDGRRVGPPLGVRSMSATSDGSAILANVHVGGIPRSTDGGTTWQPTIDVDSDVHEVCAHPAHPNLVFAAAAVGLCISRDGGATWTVEQAGLHATYCSAVGFSDQDLFVAASTDHFATEGAVYRRAINGTGPLEPVAGLAKRLKGIVDTGCIATCGPMMAVADKAGNLYISNDGGTSWQLRDSLPGVSCLLLRV